MALEFDPSLYFTRAQVRALLAQAMASIPAGSTGAKGVDGNTILSGTGVPSSSAGVNGDYYIDTASKILYGPKTAGAWSSSISLIGQTGATGLAGATGTPGAAGNTLLNGTTAPSNSVGQNGDFYLNTTTYTLYGPKSSGAWPASGQVLIGPQGTPGTSTSKWG